MRTILATLVLSLLSVTGAATAQAALLVEFIEIDHDGTLARITGDGVTDGTFQFNIDAHEIGNFVKPEGPNNQWFDLEQSLSFAPGYNITRLHVDYNPAPTLDDFRIGLDSFVGNGIGYSISAESVVRGLAFSSLIPGTYAGSTRPDVGIIGGLTLSVIPTKVIEPASTALLLSGLLALILARRQRRLLPHPLD